MEGGKEEEKKGLINKGSIRYKISSEGRLEKKILIKLSRTHTEDKTVVHHANANLEVPLLEKD